MNWHTLLPRKSVPYYDIFVHNKNIMTTFICIYAFMTVCTTLAYVKDWTTAEVVASIIIGAIWPVAIASAVIRKIIK